MKSRLCLNANSPLEAYREAFERYRQTYEIADLQERLARMREMPSLWESCFSRLWQIAETPDVEVWHALGECFQGGWGTNANREEGMRWFQRAAEAGHTQSMTRLGTMLQFQKPPGSAERAIAWFLRAAALGDSYGMVRLGFTYRDGHGVAIDSAEALRWFIKAVEAGDGHSMIFVGRIYRSALVSPTEAVKWFLRAAKAGFSESHIELAMLYDDQKSPVRDPAEAVKWYHVVADGPGGNKPRAMLALARHYRDGIGTLRSPEIAKTWLQRLLRAAPEKSPFRKEATTLLQQIQGD